MKRYGRPEVIVTDRLRSYRAAMREIGNEARQETGRWLTNRAENSHSLAGRTGCTNIPRSAVEAQVDGGHSLSPRPSMDGG